MNSLNTTSAPPPLGEQPITPMKPFVASPSPKTLTSRIISSLRYTFNFCPYRDKVKREVLEGGGRSDLINDHEHLRFSRLVRDSITRNSMLTNLNTGLLLPHLPTISRFQTPSLL
ncbi:hypothetical protein I204_05235 [Kwoniella mangroviensis CBS 8886]|nr:hypothetical protein I204_05235 [Kwoniella mangroviensis CBS 8886]